MFETTLFPSIVEQALQYATQKHNGQYRKTSNYPYIWHCMSVSRHVENFKNSHNKDLLLVSALLHDVVELYKTKEEQNTELHSIADLFGFKVASLVSELTTDKNEANKVGKTEYLKQKLLQMSSYALVIKLCDRLDNISDLQRASLEFKEKYKKETIDIIDFIFSNRKNLSKTHLQIISEIKKTLNTII